MCGWRKHGRSATSGLALQHAAAFDDHAAAGGDRQPRHQGDRGSQDERARGGHDQDRHCPLSPGDCPCGSGRGQAYQQEPQRVPVGQPDERGLRLLCLRYQADDPGVGAVGGPGRSQQIKWPPRIHHAAAHRLTLRPLDGKRLAGQRRLIQDRRAAGHRAVNRNNLARCHQQQVTWDNRVQRHGLQSAAPVTACDSGRPLQQSLQVAAGAPGSPRFQRPPAGHHHADHRSSQVLPDSQRASKSQQRDHIHAQPAMVRCPELSGQSIH